VGGNAFGTIYFVRMKDADKEAESSESKEGVS
jgi:hypothetical protein